MIQTLSLKKKLNPTTTTEKLHLIYTGAILTTRLNTTQKQQEKSQQTKKIYTLQTRKETQRKYIGQLTQWLQGKLRTTEETDKIGHRNKR